MNKLTLGCAGCDVARNTTTLNLECAAHPAGFNPADTTDRNALILLQRRFQRDADICAMCEVNDAWHDRMWNTPDIAMCLGRYKSAKQSKRYAK